MGAVIAWMDSDSRISPVNPMPTPDNNILVALQSVAAGAKTDTGIKTIGRNAGKAHS
jgi:hypothetical protein